VVAVEGERLFDSLVNDDGQTWFVGIAKLLVEAADNRLGALDQVVVFQDQVAGRGVGIQIFERVTVPMLGHIQNFFYVMESSLRLGELPPRVVDP